MTQLNALPKVTSSVHEMPSLDLSTRLRTSERMPLDVALSLSLEVVEAVAAVHVRHRVYGGFNAAELSVMPDGSVSVLSRAKNGDDLGLDTFSVGTVLFQVLTGLTPNQARSRLMISPLAAAPRASLINPALDESIDVMLSKLLDRDPTKRPASLRIVAVELEEVCDLFDLVPSRDAVAAWWAAVPEVIEPEPEAVVAAPVVAPVVAPVSKPARARHVPTIRFANASEEIESWDDEDESEDDAKTSYAPLRFDIWAVAACAFCVVAFAAATTF